MRIAGVELPKDKRIEAALPYLYGVGLTRARKILQEVGVSADKRTKELTDDEVTKISKAVEKYKIEGELKAEITGDIARLKEIGAYRGTRHAKNLPVRGQRTRSNARTKRGKRVTIGTVRKDIAARMGAKTARTQTPTEAGR